MSLNNTQYSDGDLLESKLAFAKWVSSNDIDETQYFCEHSRLDKASLSLVGVHDNLIDQSRLVVIHNTGRVFVPGQFGNLEQMKNPRFQNPLISKKASMLISGAGEAIWLKPFSHEPKVFKPWYDHLQQGMNEKKRQEIIDFLSENYKSIIEVLPKAWQESNNEFSPFKIPVRVQTGKINKSDAQQIIKQDIIEKFGDQFTDFPWPDRPDIFDVRLSVINKNTAQIFINNYFGFRGSAHSAGDSLNDFDMLNNPESYVTIVGNADQSLCDSLVHRRNDPKAYWASPEEQGPLAILAHYKHLGI